MSDNCEVCGLVGGKDKDWIGCSYCKAWFHLKCVGLEGMKEKFISRINWACDACDGKIKTCDSRMEMMQAEIASLKTKNADLDAKNADLVAKLSVAQTYVPLEPPGLSIAYMDAKFSKIESMIDGLSNGSNDRSYASAVKQKNLLAIKSCKDGWKAAEKKKEVADILADFTILDTKFPPNGNIIMNFKDKDTRDRAAQEIGGKIPDTEVNRVGYLKPKFMLCNVHLEEEDINTTDKDDIIRKIINRNDFLKNMADINSKIEFLFTRPSAANTHHLVFKCDPEVRKAIHDHNDEIKLAFAVYHVRDRYHVRICSYCQRFGHLEKDCPHKNQDPYCGKCGENHATKDCEADHEKCINCVRRKKSHTNHKVGNKHCESLLDEHRKIAAKTDHGY